MGADGYLPLGNDLADTNAEDLEGFTLRQRSNPKSRLVPTIVLSILCLVEAVALVLLTQSSNIECLPSTVLFQDTDGFSNATTEAEIDSAWSIYGLPNSGFVHIANPSEAGLTPNSGVVGDLDNVYMISAMHQLHCLQQLQKIFLRNTDESSPDAQWEKNHAAHCFNYMRQSVICSADDTLEGPDEHPEAGQSRLRGWGVPHQCRSWDGLMTFRDQHSIDFVGAPSSKGHRLS